MAHGLGKLYLKIRLTNKKLKEQQQKKPNKPQAPGTAGVTATLSQFSEEFFSEEMNTRKPTQKRPGRPRAPAAHTSRQAAEHGGSSPFAGGETSAEGRSQEQISLGQLRCAGLHQLQLSLRVSALTAVADPLPCL